jgi:hypothetical protein
MGKIVTVIGNIGFLYLAQDNIKNLNNKRGWIVFPANKFEEITSIFEKETNPFEDFYWYLGTSPLNNEIYHFYDLGESSRNMEHISCSYKKNGRMPFFESEEKFKSHFEKSSIKFNKKEIELWEKVMNKILISPDILKQSFNQSELIELINIAKDNDSKFQLKVLRINNTNDSTFEFFHKPNGKLKGFFDGLTNLINKDEKRPKFSFRLTDLNEISTNDGQVFEVRTTVGNYFFPWLFKLNASNSIFAPNEDEWSR